MANNKTVSGNNKAVYPNWFRPLLIGGILIVAVISIIIGVHQKNKAKRDAFRVEGCTFSTEGFENVVNIETLGEKINVYTGKDGKKGIMLPDGTITASAEQDDIYLVSENWREYMVVADGPDSEYSLIVDTETGEITKKQYNKAKEPEKIPCWDPEEKCLKWTDKYGYSDVILKKNLYLEPGLYPISDTIKEDAMWGYINGALDLDLAMVFEQAREFSSDMAAVKKDGNWGYINSDGLTVIPFEFEMAWSFRNGLAPVMKDGKYGIIDKTGTVVVDFGFEEILPGKEGKYVGKKNNVWGLITVDNEKMLQYTETETQSSGETETKQYKVTTSGSALRLRSSADTNSQVLAQIPNGTVLTVTKTEFGWAYTTYNSKSGWVSLEYLTVI